MQNEVGKYINELDKEYKKYRSVKNIKKSINLYHIKDDYYIHRDILEFDDDTYLFLIKYINEHNLPYDKLISVYKEIYRIIVSDRDNIEEYSLFIKLIPYIDNKLINKEIFEILYSLVENKKNLFYLCKKYTETYKYYTETLDLGFDTEKIINLLNLFKEYRKYCIDDSTFISTLIKFFNSKFKYKIENDIEILKYKNQDKDIYELNEAVEKVNEYYRNITKQLEEEFINIEKQKNKINQQLEKRDSILNDYINDKLNLFNKELEKIENNFSNSNDEINKRIENEMVLKKETSKIPISSEDMEKYITDMVNIINENSLVEYSIKNKNVNLKQILKEGLMYGDIEPMDMTITINIQLEAYTNTYINHNLNIYRSVKSYINSHYMSFNDATILFNNDNIKYFDEDTYISLFPNRIIMLLEFIRNSNQKILSDILKINPEFNNPYGSRCNIKKMIEVFGIDVVANSEEKFVTDISALYDEQYEYYKKLIDINPNFTFEFRELIYENKIYTLEEFAYLDINIQRILYGLLPEYQLVLDVLSINGHGDTVKNIISYYTSQSTEKGRSVNIDYFLIPMYENAKDKEKFLENYSKMTSEEQCEIINKLDNNINIYHDELETLNKKFYIKKEINKILRRNFK